MAKKELASSFLNQMKGTKEPSRSEEKRSDPIQEPKNSDSPLKQSLIDNLTPVKKTQRDMYPVYLNEEEHALLMQAAVELGLTRKKKGEDVVVGNLSAMIQYIAQSLKK